MQKYLFFFFISLHVFCAPFCSQPLSSDGFFSGAVFISNASQAKTSTQKGINQTYSIIAALSTSPTSIFSVAVKFFLSISIPQQDIISIFLTINLTFVLAKVNYLSTTINRIFLGSFNFIPIEGQSFNYTLKNFPNELPSTTAVFITGLQSPSLNQFFVSSKVEDGVLSVSLVTEASIVNLTLSYAIFLEEQFTVTFTATDDNVQSAQYSLIGLAGSESMKRISISFERYDCNGVNCAQKCVNERTCLSLNGVLKGKNCFTCQQYEHYEGKCVCNENAIGTVGNCKRCAGNKRVVEEKCTCEYPLSGYYDDINNSLCLSKKICLQGSYFNSDSLECECLFHNQIYDKVAGCICSINEYLNVLTQQCECDSNSRFANFCVPCQPNSKQHPTDNSSCQCNNGFVAAPSLEGTLNCIGAIVCPSPQILDSHGSCQCKFASQILDGSACVCTRTRTFDGVFCSCNQGLYSPDSKGHAVCVPCWANSLPSSDRLQCVCNAGYYASQPMVCSPTSECGTGSTWDDAFGQCQCDDPTMIFTPDRTRCVCPPSMLYDGAKCSCPPTAVLIPLQDYPFFVCRPCRPPFNCPCKKGTYQKGTVCLAQNCPALAMHFSSITNKCECNIFLQTVVNGQCKCPNGMKLDYTSKYCVCSNDKYFNSSSQSCILCGEGFEPTPDQTKCVCRKGRTKNSNGDCVQQSCPIGAIFSGVGCRCESFDQLAIEGVCRCAGPLQSLNDELRCVCPPTMYFDGVRCTRCVANALLINGLCECIRGYIPQPQGSCLHKTCQQGAVYDYSSDKCLCSLKGGDANNKCKCGKHMIAVNGECVCDSVSVRNSSDQCTLCPANAKSNEKECVCNKGFTKDSSGKCVNDKDCNAKYNDLLQTGLIQFNAMPKSQYAALTVSHNRYRFL